MNAKNIQELMRLLGCTKIKQQPNGWISSTCPLAPWTHGSGHDNHPSFGIVTEDYKLSSYKCLACHERGTLRHLYYVYTMKAKKTIDGVANFIDANDKISVEQLVKQITSARQQWATPSQIGGITLSYTPKQEEIEEAKVDDSISESEFDKLVVPPEEVMKWLTNPKIPVGSRVNNQTPRGLTLATIEKFQLKWNPTAKRLIIPVRDVNGRLVSLSSRAFYSWQKPKFMHSSKFKKQWYLAGENLVKPARVGILVEGNLDVPMLHQNGYSTTLSNMGSDLGKVQFEKICKWFKEVIYIRDGDEAGKKAAAMIAAQFKGIMPCTIIDLDDGLDPDDLSPSELESKIGTPDSLI